MSDDDSSSRVPTFIVNHPRGVTGFLIFGVAAHALAAARWSEIPTFAENLDGVKGVTSFYLGAAGSVAMIGGFAGIVVVFAMTQGLKRFAKLRDYERQYRALAAQLADIGTSVPAVWPSATTVAATRTVAATPTRHRCTAPTGSGPPKSTGKPSTDASAKPKQFSTKNGSPTTDTYATSSPKCVTSQPKPQNS